MSAVNAKLTQALFPLLTATLLAMACSDSTAPSPGEGAAGDSPAQLPTETRDTSAGLDSLPNPELGDAPTLDRPAPGDTTQPSLKPSFMTQFESPPTEWAPRPGVVKVSLPVMCWGAHAGRHVVVDGMVVGRTDGFSSFLDQRVRAKFWFYRWNGRTWVAEGLATAKVSMRGAKYPLLPDLAARLPTATHRPTAAGYYKVVVQLFWDVDANGSWFQSAWNNVYFDAAADYLGAFGGTSGKGPYCGVL